MAWIAGKKVVLRAWERDDVRAAWEAEQTADASGLRMRDWHEPPASLAEMEAEFDGNISEPSPTRVALIIEAEGRPVGDINFFDIDERNRRAMVGLGIWRAEDRGKGYGSDALRALLRWGFRHLNLHRVELGVAPENEAALRTYRSLGFVEEGRRRQSHFDDGRYVDEIIMGLLRSEFERDSPPK